MKISNKLTMYKYKIRLVYLLSLAVILALIFASNISMMYFKSITVSRMAISTVLLTISGIIISIPIYITTNMIKSYDDSTLSALNILLNITGLALLMMLIYILFTIYRFIVCIPLV